MYKTIEPLCPICNASLGFYVGNITSEGEEINCGHFIGTNDEEDPDFEKLFYFWD
jgi:hypothetical protein